MTTQPLFPVDLYFQPPAKRADGRRADVAGHIPYHPEVARALRRSLPRNFHANVPMLALFLAACFRWTGKSTKKRDAGDLSFGKTIPQWEDELGISKHQVQLAFSLLCVDGHGKAKGRPNLGLVRCITRAHRGGVENRFTFLPEQAAQWWLTYGPQPALPLSTGNPQPLLNEGGSADQPSDGSADQPSDGSADQPSDGSADQPSSPYKHTNKQADKQTTGGGGGGGEWFFKIRTALMGHCVSEPTASRLATALQDSEEWALESIEDTASQIIQSINVQSTPALLVTRLKGQFHLTGI